jgi:hypothetical protein
MCLSIFLFLSELGTCPQNFIPTRGVEHWEQNNFPQGGMLKNTKISIFGGISKVRLWADFGKFGQFWVVLGRPRLVPKISSCVEHGYHWGIGWSIHEQISSTCLIRKAGDYVHFPATLIDSLCTLAPILCVPQKVSKILKIECIHSSLPKITKFHIWNPRAFRG